MEKGRILFNFFEDISNLTGLPFDYLTKGFRVINLSNRAVYVEGYKGLIDTESGEMNIKLKKGVIKLTGKNLKIKNLNIETLLVVGEIQTIEMN
ncbi:MAG: hypothetical protein EOM55_03660 [Clostridia bacterium]|nr:hypothetical protein [Clostridia bacterium]